MSDISALYMPRSEALRQLGVSQSTMTRLLRRNKIKALRFGTHRRETMIHRDVVKMLQEQRQRESSHE